MYKHQVLFLIFLLFSASLWSQDKKKIDYHAYDEWKTIRTHQFSKSGKYLFYDAAPLEGDATLYLKSTADSFAKEFRRAKNPQFSKDETCFVFLVEPEFDTLRKLKLAETPKDKLPKDSLFIYRPLLDSFYKIADVKSFQFAEEGNYLAWLSHKDPRPDCPKESEKKKKKKKAKNSCVKKPTSGTRLTLYNYQNGQEKQFDCVTGYQVGKNGDYLLYTQSHKGKKDTLSLWLYNVADSTTTLLLDYQYAINSFTQDESGNQVAILASADTNKTKNFSLYYFNYVSKNLTRLVDSTSVGMPANYTVSEFGKPAFSKDGKVLFFGTSPLQLADIKDTLLSTEKAKVDIWGPNDNRIQPVQLTELSSDQKKNYRAAYYFELEKFVQLGSEKIPTVRNDPFLKSAYLLGSSDSAYQREATWEYPWKSDYFVIDRTNGKIVNELKGCANTVSLSPAGEFILYYASTDSAWFVKNVNTSEIQNLSDKTKDLFAADNNGLPSVADEEGFAAWTLIDGNEYAIISARFNLWFFCPADASKNFSLHAGDDVKSIEKLNYYRLDSDSLYTDIHANYIIGINDLTKKETVYKITRADDKFSLDKLISSDHKYTSILKAEEADKILFRRMNFTVYPDLELSNTRFENPLKISDINPQQKEYNWGTVEIISWTNYNGKPLRGLLYKPEDFDSSKSYPMIVYFYEKYVDDVHLYYAPKPTASIVYATEYVSNGYIIFIPDIEYKPGYPAQSAYDCIMSGTDHVIRKYDWIDSTRMGLQGQSWGGYQTAQLVTMTNRYKAAMAGAPVSNMFSAYGGIRWGSGYSRMFQYERTQSRIGYTIWERPDLYMLNSPLFGLPKVTTPLLIMSNDGDGAVPWYQGIELYMGLRRLGKTAWLLNYNGDEHNLMQQANRRDLSIRMRQFFDYYLLGTPAPAWMFEGVPAIDKGKNYGLQLENLTR